MARIVFMGTPDFAVPSLLGLMGTQEIVAAVTQPDRPAGRRRVLRESPIKRLAQESGIPVLQPRRIRDADAIAALKRCRADVFVVAAYGQILPQTVLDLPRIASINVHASLLPRWRGAAPIQAAILAGDEQTGATIMLMDAGLDTGPVLAQSSIPIDERETGQTLHDKLASLGSELLVESLQALLDGELLPRAQDDALATYAPSIKKGQGEIDWSRPAANIDRQVRAFTPWPGTYTYWAGSRLKIHAGYTADGAAPIGKVIRRGGMVAIGTGCGLYLPTDLQLEGKTRQIINDFVNGHNTFLDAELQT